MVWLSVSLSGNLMAAPAAAALSATAWESTLEQSSLVLDHPARRLALAWLEYSVDVSGEWWCFSPDILCETRRGHGIGPQSGKRAYRWRA